MGILIPAALPVLAKRYPYLVFYREHTGYIDVWRALHARRDMPQWMQEPDNH
ncbi:death on curing protein, Doc toxin (plasmid) [Sinorhizobium americanum]|uniref:Death on curing protein, Doc toxin n=1 Tax=Sinorhizobium americanum TaxID=194963 RepID=A0A1L3LSU6_9HYPH|nr:death on curing protein, Doc toxin [Sinorhizobium americanum]